MTDKPHVAPEGRVSPEATGGIRLPTDHPDVSPVWQLRLSRAGRAGMRMSIGASLVAAIAVWLDSGVSQGGVSPSGWPVIVDLVGLGLVATAGLLSEARSEAAASILGITTAIGAASLLANAVRTAALPSDNSVLVLTLLAGGGLLMLRPKEERRGLWLVVLASVIAGTAALGMAYGEPRITVFPFSADSTTLPAELVAVLLGPSMLLSLEARRPSPLSSAGPGGMMMRRLTPLMILVPIAGFAYVEGQTLLQLPGLLAMAASMVTVAFLGFFGATARHLDMADHQARQATDAVSQRAPIVAHLADALRSIPVDRIGPITITSVFKPAEGYVAGDCFGVQTLGDDRLGLVMVDGTGHGAEPALLSLRLRDALLQSLLVGVDPGEALASVRWLLADTQLMATSVVAVVDGRTGHCSVAAAGHPLPVVVGQDEPRTVGRTGPILASILQGVWPTGSTRLEKGERIVFYTDGVADVYPVAGAESGHQAFARHLAGFSGDPDEFAEWCARFPGILEGPRDDAAVVVLAMDSTPSSKEPASPAASSIAPASKAGDAARNIGGA